MKASAPEPTPYDQVLEFARWEDDVLIAAWYNGSGCALKDAQQTTLIQINHDR
jgi:hypothetical protein